MIADSAICLHPLTFGLQIQDLSVMRAVQVTVSRSTRYHSTSFHISVQ